MTRLKTSSGQFGLIGGICRASSDCILIQEPSPASPVARWKGSLYILAEPVMEGGRGYQAARQAIVEIGQNYYACSSPSITTCLGRAIREANRNLFQHNMQVSGHEKITIGVTCAVARGEELFIAQVLPGQAYVVHQGRIKSFPLNPSWDPEATTLPTMARLLALGWAEDITPEFFHSPLSPGDVFCLSTSNIGRFLGKDEAEQILLYQEPGDVVEQLYRRVHQQGFNEAHAIVVEMRPAVSRQAAAFFSKAGFKERTRLAGEALVAWGSFVGGEARRLLTRPREAGRKPVRARPRPRPEPAAPPPEMPPPLVRPKPTGPWWKSLQQKLYNLFHPHVVMPRLERPRLRIPPARQKRRWPPYALGATALAVLVTLVVLFVRGCQGTNEATISQMIAAAQVQIDDASRVISVAEANHRLATEQDLSQITDANERLDQTEKLLQEFMAKTGPIPRIELTLRDLRDERDRLDSITRFETLDMLLDMNAISTTMATEFPQGCRGDCALHDLVLISSTVYLLDQTRGTVYGFSTTTNHVTPVLGPGVLLQDCLGRSIEAGPILDITLLKRVGTCSAGQPIATWLAAVDANRVLYVYHQGEWQTFDLFSQTSWQSQTVDLDNYDGNLYVLNGELNQILKYYRNSYEMRPEAWLQDIPRVQTQAAVDMAIDGSIHLLLNDGKTVQVLSKGYLDRTLTYWVYPPTIFPSEITVDPQNLEGPYLYVVDRYGRIIQLRKEGPAAFVRVLEGPSEDDLREMQAALVLEKQGRANEDIFYMVVGARLYRGIVSAPAEELPLPTPSPSPTAAP
jgi:serine/threonine protein phosphatase PrpC